MARDPKKRGLGMGLGALFESSKPVEINPSEDNTPKTKMEDNGIGAISEEGSAVIYINVNDLKPNANQPRKNFDEEKIEDLANSIIEHGIIQPLIVRASKTGYEIVAGERRYRAARKAGLKEVPCLIREFTDEENMLVAIIENMQREDLDPIEEAEGLNQMVKTYGLTQDEVSKSVGKSRPYITNALRLLKLSDEIRELVSKGELSSGHARAILALSDEEKRLDLAKKIVKEGLSVREAEKIASGTIPHKGVPAKKRRKDKDILYVEAELKDILGTKVNISGTSNSGAIEIEYYSKDELNRLIDMLRSIK